MGVPAAILYHPTVLTLFISKAGIAPWAVARMEAMFIIAGYALIPNAAIGLLSKAFNSQIVFLTALGLMIVWGLQPRESHHFEWYMIKRRTKVASLEEQRALLQRYIPKGAIVLADAVEAKRLVQLHDVYVIAANRMSPGLIGAQQRKADVGFLWNRHHRSWREQEQLLHYYGVTHAFTRSLGVERVLRRTYGDQLDILYGGQDGLLIAEFQKPWH